METYAASQTKSVSGLDGSIISNEPKKIEIRISLVTKRNGKPVDLDLQKIRSSITRAAKGFESDIDVDLIIKEVLKNIYDRVNTSDIEKALILASTPFIEKDPAYDFLAARLLLQKIYKEVIGCSINEDKISTFYKNAFTSGIKKGVENKLFTPKLLEFDLEKLANSLSINKDNLFGYIGIQTLYERYFVKHAEKRIELPQSFWMRVAMGLSLNESQKTEKAIEFYKILSSLRYVSGTPTLFHSGLIHPQLSSCYLTTIDDDLFNIFKCLGDNAQLSKWSGGVGNDWTNLRGTGALINSIKVTSQGLIPFLKIANDVTTAISRSGSRRGATCAYLETWHYDIEDFLDLRRNTGDDRRRTHDMNTANWIPDLFMKRVINNDKWTLFSPDETPELHHIYGKEFENKYIEYEEKAKNGEIKLFKVISAQELWKKMLSRLFETGHPWLTFKDPCNIRSPQDHVGVVHSSNLCTEITLNTSKDETAVCNLGSINLEKHVVNGVLDKELLAESVKTAIRMLDNVIDINFYPTKEAKNSNLKHRPIGLGIMGFADALFKLNINFESQEALEFTDNTMEFISYNAILASSELAKEKGAYESYKGSKWDRNLFPLDTIDILEKERNMPIEVSRTSSIDWTPVREHVKKYGMRNSNTMAIAPTATISNISGCFPCIEPIYKNIYVKANMSGEFTVVNHYLVRELKKLGLWNQEMLEKIKFYDGNLSEIEEIPVELKNKYKEAFDIDPIWLIKLTAVRAKWIDQSQSHNVFMKGTSGKLLNNIYIAAWKMGLKTLYYLRTLGASQIEKSTLDASKYGFTQKRNFNKTEEQMAVTINVVDTQYMETTVTEADSKFCRITDPECESCQ